MKGTGGSASRPVTVVNVFVFCRLVSRLAIEPIDVLSMCDHI